MSGADPSPPGRRRPEALTADIAPQLERILSSHSFKNTAGLRDLLRFVVVEALEGRGRELKEYVLGATVLRRGDAFDPKADGIVRVQMRRLRERLEQYYATEGRHDAWRIEIPKGTYAPAFRTAESASSTPQAMAAPLVGREPELADLRAAYGAAAVGHGVFVSVAGEPGIGKTTLVESLLREVRSSGADCVVGRGYCSERLAGNEAYLPLLEALEDLLRDGQEPLAMLMRTIAPLWYAKVARDTHDPTDHRLAAGAQSQERLKRELVVFMDECSRRQPVVMFLDDLHWADASTVDVLAYWGRRCPSQRVLILGTYRPAELARTGHPFGPVKLELQGHGMCRETTLQLLGKPDLDRYLTLRFPGHTFPPALIARIYERTEGNPLFMTGLVRFLQERGVLSDRAGAWTMVCEIGALDADLPESVRSMIEKRIGELSEIDRQLLSTAAVQGQEFDAAIIARVLGMDAADTEERLESLERTHGVVRMLGGREFPDKTFTLRYTFVHVLYQNALYASLRPTRRVSWSAAVAEALVGHYGAQTEAIASGLAMLYDAARDPARASMYFLAAAERAAAGSANTEAVALARRGLDSVAQLPVGLERSHRELCLQTVLGPALMSTVGHGAPEVEAAYVRASELCSQVGEMPQRFTATYGLYQYWLARADYRRCGSLADQLLALAVSRDDPALLLPAHSAVSNTLCYSGNFEGARAHAERAMAIYVPDRDHGLAALYSGFDLGVGCGGGLSVNLWALGYPDRALRAAEQALALARGLGHASSLVLALMWTAMVHQHRREAARTQEYAEAAIARAVEELAPWLAWARILRGWAMARQGQGPAGIEELRRGLAAWRAGGLECLVPFFLSLLADALATFTQTEAARSTLTEALALTVQTREGYAEAELHRQMGDLQTDPEDAGRFLEQAVAIARRQQAKSLELRALTSVRRLEQRTTSGSSRQDLLAVSEWFAEGVDAPDLVAARALL